MCAQGAGHGYNLWLALDDPDADAHLGEEGGFEEADGAGADDQDGDLLDRR